MLISPLQPWKWDTGFKRTHTVIIRLIQLRHSAQVHVDTSTMRRRRRRRRRRRQRKAGLAAIVTAAQVVDPLHFHFVHRPCS